MFCSPVDSEEPSKEVVSKEEVASNNMIFATPKYTWRSRGVPSMSECCHGNAMLVPWLLIGTNPKRLKEIGLHGLLAVATLPVLKCNLCW